MLLQSGHRAGHGARLLFLMAWSPFIKEPKRNEPWRAWPACQIDGTAWASRPGAGGSGSGGLGQDRSGL